MDMVGTATVPHRPAFQGKAAPAKSGAPGLLSGLNRRPDVWAPRAKELVVVLWWFKWIESRDVILTRELSH
jgi:hypothetical protein